MQQIDAIEIGREATTEPLVSVLMLAHSHERYVQQAIDSVVSQKTDFDYELLIGVDFSNDRTREICMQMQQGYSDKIALTIMKENVGMHRNFMHLWSKSRARLISFCEGDDYWCDENKLAKQIEMFEEILDLALCGTETRVIELGKKNVWLEKGAIRPPGDKKCLEFVDLIKHYNFHFSSVMLKKDLVEFPDWFYKSYCVDRPIYLLAGAKGRAQFIPETMSVYRRHQSGSWAMVPVSARAGQSMDLFKTMARYFDQKYRSIFARTLGEILWSYMSEALGKGDTKTARALYWKAIPRLARKPLQLNPRLIAVAWLRLYLPGLHSAMKSVVSPGV